MPARPRPMPDPPAASYRGIAKPATRFSPRPPTPGPHGRPGTPTPSPLGNMYRPETPTGFHAQSRTVTLRMGSWDTALRRQRSHVMKEKYRQLEEQSRAQRPVMVSAVRSFSYEIPTHETEMQAMIRAHDSSPLQTSLPRRSCSESP